MVFEVQGDVGLKYARLLHARRHFGEGGIVPPLFPVGALAPPSAVPPAGDRQAAYTAAVRLAYPTLVADVAAVCGPPPWIVRSSGDEDFDDQTNAGGYDSVICHDSRSLLDCVARVALSGMSEHARPQLSLTGAASDRAIPCFVQPLLDTRVAPAVEPDQSPYLDDLALDRIEHVIDELLDMFGMDAIDCEWGIETDVGFVSGTSIVARDKAAMNDEHAFGFGFAAAQTIAGRPVASVLVPAGTRLRLRRGKQMRRAKLRRLHLLQARPANPSPALHDVMVLSNVARAQLDTVCDRRDAALIQPGRRGRGPFLTAPTLATAWRRYLAMEPERRAALSIVVTDEGHAAEHAGIMFRQEGVTCLLTDTGRVPVNAAWALFDRDRCYFGDALLIDAVESEVRAILPLPADCFHSFAEARADLHLFEQGMAALPLDDTVRAAIVARSLWPSEDCWLADGIRVQSPAAASGATGTTPHFADRYLRAARLADSEMRPEPGRLHAAAVAFTDPDLRIGVAALGLRERDDRDDVDRERAIALAAAHVARGDRRGARLLLEQVTRTVETLDRLPVYDSAERRGWTASLVRVFGMGVDPEAARALDLLQLPVPAAIGLLEAAATDPPLHDAALRFQHAYALFLGATHAEAPIAARALNEATRGLAAGLTSPALVDVAGLIRGNLIEAYDARLKVMLLDLVSGPDDRDHYLSAMRAWIDWARDTGVSATESDVLERFDHWLAEARTQPAPESYVIEDRNWRIEFPQVAAGAVAGYENPHVLHNLLHQWLLSRNLIGTSLLPSRLRDLHHFCTTFSMRATNVLRFTADMFELEIPMGTHKVSFLLTAQAIVVEWSEPPDCPGDEIARILTFELLLDRFRKWRFGTLSFHREEVLGTWTLFIRIARPAEREWTFDDFRQAVVALRFLFDGSYDFSYVENAAVDGLRHSLEHRDWRPILTKLLAYRAVFDDTAQYVFLHTVPLSSAVATLARNRIARGMMRRCYRSGFDRTMALIDILAISLDRPVDVVRWSRRYELLRQLALLTAASWPDEAIRRLALRGDGHVGDELLTACVLRRTDMHDLIRALAAAGGTPSFSARILRHAPDLLLTKRRAAGLAASIGTVFATGKRAKQYLIAYRTEDLDETMLGRIVGDLDTVPLAADPVQEARVEAAVRAHTAPWLRFDVRRGVDWTTLSVRHDAAIARSTSSQLDAEA